MADRDYDDDPEDEEDEEEDPDMEDGDFIDDGPAEQDEEDDAPAAAGTGGAGADDSDYDDAPSHAGSKRKRAGSAGKKQAAAGKKKAGKRARMDAARMFIEDSAALGDDDEEEEEDGGELGDDPVEVRRAAEEVQRRRRKWQQMQIAQQGETEEELAARIERQAAVDSAEAFDDDGAEEALAGVGGDAARKARLPTMRDPKLYILKVKPGKERDVLAQLVSASRAAGAAGGSGVLSAVSPQTLRGYIYVEAAREADARAAVAGLRYTLGGGQLQIVPLAEMESVVAAAAAREAVRPGAWVRVRRGLYKGDIAQVTQVDPANSMVEIKLVPRIDYAAAVEEAQGAATAGASADDNNKGARKPGAAFGKKGGAAGRKRPEPKFFVPEDLGIARGDIEQRHDARLGTVVTWKTRRFANGYIIKSVSTTALETAGVRPTFDELQHFDREGLQGMDREAVAALVAGAGGRGRADSFRRGDVVRVCDGDLLNLVATVERVEADQVFIRAHDPRVPKPLPVPPSQLIKHFKLGDHVRVCSGVLEGVTGTVRSVDSSGVAPRASVIRDTDHSEFTALVSDLCLSAATDGGRLRDDFNAVGGYRVGDLVLLPAQKSAGVIVRVENAGAYAVLDAEGRAQVLPAAQIGRRVGSSGSASHGARHNSRAEQGYDSKAKAITSGDLVQVNEGPMSGRQAVVRHLYKHRVFLYSRDLTENSGIFVVQTRHTSLIGTGPGARPAPQDMQQAQGGFQWGRGRGGQMGPPERGGFGGRGGRGRGSARNTFVGKKCKIVRGSWKGYVGVVKEATETTLHVELQANDRRVPVAFGEVKFDDLTLRHESARADNFASFAAPPTPSQYATPATPSRAPMTPSAIAAPMTPSAAPMTPSRDLWNPALATPGRSQWDPSDPYSPAPAVSYTPSDVGPPKTPSLASTPGYVAAPAYTPASAASPAMPPPGAYTPAGPMSAATPVSGLMDDAATPQVGTPRTPGLM